MMQKFLARILSRENVMALLFALILIALIVFTADVTPNWIYQGF